MQHLRSWRKATAGRDQIAPSRSAAPTPGARLFPRSKKRERWRPVSPFLSPSVWRPPQLQDTEGEPLRKRPGRPFPEPRSTQRERVKGRAAAATAGRCALLACKGRSGREERAAAAAADRKARATSMVEGRPEKDGARRTHVGEARKEGREAGGERKPRSLTQTPPPRSSLLSFKESVESALFFWHWDCWERRALHGWLFWACFGLEMLGWSSGFPSASASGSPVYKGGTREGNIPPCLWPSVFRSR